MIEYGSNLVANVSGITAPFVSAQLGAYVDNDGNWHDFGLELNQDGTVRWFEVDWKNGEWVRVARR